MNGPSPCRVVTKSAWVRAATRESWIPVAAALVGMSSVVSAVTENGILDTSRQAIRVYTIDLRIVS